MYKNHLISIGKKLIYYINIFYTNFMPLGPASRTWDPEDMHGLKDQGLKDPGPPGGAHGGPNDKTFNVFAH